MITFSPVWIVWLPIVKIVPNTEVTEYFFTELVEASDIKIFAECSVPDAVKYNLSLILAPIRYPWVWTGGATSLELNP